MKDISEKPLWERYRLRTKKSENILGMKRFFINTRLSIRTLTSFYKSYCHLEKFAGLFFSPSLTSLLYYVLSKSNTFRVVYILIYNKGALTFNVNDSACVSSNGKFHVLNNPMLWSTTTVVKHSFLFHACISHQHSTFSENVLLCTHRGECSQNVVCCYGENRKDIFPINAH